MSLYLVLFFTGSSCRFMCLQPTLPRVLVRRVSTFPRAFYRFQVFLYGPIVCFLPIFFRPFYRYLLVFPKGVSGFLWVFFRVLRPFVLVRHLRVKPTSIGRLLRVLVQYRVHGLTNGLFFRFLFYLQAGYPSGFLRPIVYPLPKNTFFGVIRATLRQVQAACPRVLGYGVSNSTRTTFLRRVPRSRSTRLFIRLHGVFHRVGPSAFFFRKTVGPLRAIYHHGVGAPSTSHVWGRHANVLTSNVLGVFLRCQGVNGARVATRPMGSRVLRNVSKATLFRIPRVAISNLCTGGAPHQFYHASGRLNGKGRSTSRGAVSNSGRRRSGGYAGGSRAFYTTSFPRASYGFGFHNSGRYKSRGHNGRQGQGGSSGFYSTRGRGRRKGSHRGSYRLNFPLVLFSRYNP